MPRGPALQAPRSVPVPSALWQLPGPQLLQPRNVCCLVCGVLGAWGRPAVGSSGMSLAVWEGAGGRHSPHGCPRARRAEGVLAPVPTPGPRLVPSAAPPPASAWSGAAKSPCLCSSVLPQPTVRGPRQSPAVNHGAPIAGVLWAGALLCVCSLRRCCKHPTISHYISGRGARAEDSVIPAGSLPAPPSSQPRPSHLRPAGSKHRSSGEL